MTIAPPPARPTRWRTSAACRGTETDVFFPVGGSGARATAYTEAVRNAKRICGVCAVAEQCLDYVMNTEDDKYRHGVWGGLTAEERTKLARGRGKDSDE